MGKNAYKRLKGINNEKNTKNIDNKYSTTIWCIYFIRHHNV